MLSCVALVVTFSVAYAVWLLFAETRGGKTMGLVQFGIPTAICSYLLVAQRLRDIGISGWFALLWYVVNAFDPPVRLALTATFVLVLCGIPGNLGPNRYGDDPLA